MSTPSGRDEAAFATSEMRPETLPRRADFLRAAAHGRKLARPGFVVQILPTTTEAPLRVGFTASRKVGNAVHRNRARRRLRAMLRLELEGRAIVGTDLVLIARKDTASIDFATLRTQLAAVLDQTFPRPANSAMETVR